MKKNLTKSVMIAVMKFSIIPVILFTFAFNAYAGKVNAQDLLKKKLNIKFQSEEIGTVLSKFEGITTAKFVYSPELIESSRKVSIAAKDEEFAKVLTNLLMPLGIKYEVIDNYIILSREGSAQDNAINMPATNTTGSISNVNKEINGIVSNSKNELLAGVSITIKGTNKGTTTDSKGFFNLSIDEDKKVMLEISLVGYQTQMVSVGKQKQFKDYAH